MGFLELFILAVGVSMDAFAVSICKGLAVKKVTLKECAICGGRRRSTGWGCVSSIRLVI